MKLKAYKGKVSIDPDSIATKELKRLLGKLETELADDKMYNQVSIFIFLVCDLSNDNPLVDRPYNSKKQDALEVAFGKDLDKFIKLKDSNEWIRETVNSCIKIYLEDENTDEQKDISTYSKKMDQFRTMLHGMKPRIEKNTHETSLIVSYSTNMDIINSVLNDIVSLIQTKASMVALYTTGVIPKHLRGGLSPLAQGDLVPDKIDLTGTDEDEDADK